MTTIPVETTDYGFRYGAATVERLWNRDDGYVVIGIRTDAGKEIDIYVSPQGRRVHIYAKPAGSSIRLHLGGKELTR